LCSGLIDGFLVENLFHIDKITKKKKLNSDFKYLKEFENSIKDK